MTTFPPSQVLQCLIHCADLSNPAKPVDIAVEWATRVMEEQFRQGDEEKRLGLDIGPLCDRDSVCIEQCQVGDQNYGHLNEVLMYSTHVPHSQVTFIDYFLHPLWETWAELVFPDAQPMMDYLAKTREHWSRLIPKSPSPPAGDHQEEAEIFEEGSARVEEHSAVNILQSPEHLSQKR